MSNYRRGQGAEYRAIKDLERVGYVCIRAAGSLGPFDVVAISPLGVRLIQVKRVREGNVSAGERELIREQMEAFRTPANVTKELWVWRDRQGWIRQEVF